jgi:hypothetical protein
MDKFHLERARMGDFIPLDEPIHFHFDEHLEGKSHVRAAWDEYMANRPDAIRHLYGGEPRFESSVKFAPLQAADLWVWWVRKWWDDGEPERILEHHFGDFQRSLKINQATIDIVFREDDFIPTLVGIVKDHIPFGREVYVFSRAPEIIPMKN